MKIVRAISFGLIILLNLIVINNSHAQERCAITEKTPPLVSAGWLAEHIDHKNLVLLHVGRKAEYEAGHIPGARHISNRDISLPHVSGGLALELPSPEVLRANLEKFGINNDSRIIIYFGKDWVTSATRVYFTLDYLGLRNNASLLDGGMPAWVGSGKTLSKEIPGEVKGNLKIEANDSKVAGSKWILSKLSDQRVKIVDARLAQFYKGTAKGSFPRHGHIKGAKNIPFTSFVGKDLKFKDKEALAGLFKEAGIKAYDTIVVYCHIGQQATIAYFAAKSAGLKVKLYDGSFQEWSRDESLPVVGPKVEKEANASKKGAQVHVVSPAWLAEHAGDKNLRILDVRLNVYDYFSSHVPNAVHLADASLRGPRYGYPTQYFDPSMTAKLFTLAGIEKGHKVAVYSDGSGVLGATMVTYLLERYGHKEIYFVDGGFRDFKSSQKTVQKYPVYEGGNFKPINNPAVKASLEDVKKSIGKKGVTFIDARPPDVYRGEVKLWTRNGHIPGAINIPWVKLMEENNRHKLKPVSELRKVFEKAGVKPTDDIIVYCGTSREASLEYMILKHILKAPKVRLYEGSWTEYSNYPQLTVATGDGTKKP